MSLLLPFFARKYCPWRYVCFVKNERLECEIKVSLEYYSAFLLTSYVESILEDTISRDSAYPAEDVNFKKPILSSSHKLADADPAVTLYSCSVTQNEQKNKQNNVIEI